ncbi:MAG: hypothetical protein ACD_46C00722G0005 [uncultured bacterium]|nr:MAG: hypothetical protein ACD_46C00722G0005 [uncultured bacterium]
MSRSFLKLNLILLICLNVFAHSIYAANSSNSKADVIIIGAGVAGLTAAQELKKQGFSPLILEARDRIGGRVYTVQPWGASTDLGASWIHKSNNNPLKSLVNKNNLQTQPTIYSTDSLAGIIQSADVYDANGKKINDIDITQDFFQIKKFKTYLDKNASSYNDQFSVADAIREYNKTHGMKTEILRLLQHIGTDLGSFESGIENTDISIKGVNEIEAESSAGGHDVLFNYGYSQLIAQLTKNIPILLNQVVKQIDYDKNGVTVHTKNATYQAKYVVSTLSLGVLKAGTVNFNPALPAEKQTAIKQMGFGLYDKIYLLFDKIFWNNKHEWQIFLSDSANPDETLEVLNYNRFSKQPILLVFTAGNFAKQLEALPDEQVITKIMAILKKTYGSNSPNPTAYLITRWWNDPFSRGSYSYPRIGSSEMSYKILAKPIQNKVFFAGEATSWAEPSTVTGAYLSGLRVAKEIAQVAKKSA